MKKGRKNRAVAIALTVLMVAGSIPLGVNRTESREASAALSVFYNGENQDGYGVQYDLEQRMATAANLLTVAGRYMEADDPALTALRTARQELMQADSVAKKYDANVRLSDAAATVLSRLENMELSESDKKYPAEFETDLAAAQDRIARSPYNRLAQEYNSGLSQFPVDLLRGIAGVEELELFL